MMRVYNVDKVYYQNELLDIFDIFDNTIYNTIYNTSKVEIILEYTDSYTKCNMKIDKYNILNQNYKIEKYTFENMKLLTINEVISNVTSTKYKIEIELNRNNHKHIELYNKIDNLRLELVHIIQTNLEKKIKTIIPSKELLVVYLNYSTKIYDYNRKMITIEDLIVMNNHKKTLKINGLFEIECMTLILDTIYIKKYIKELYILEE